MKKGLILILMALLPISMTTAAWANEQGETSMKKAIVVTSFGTTFDEARTMDIAGIETAIKEAFPAYDTRRAFTSNIVRKRLADRGIEVDSLSDALKKLAEEGYEEVYIQPTLLTPGEEYDKKIMAAAQQFQADQTFAKLAVGRPLLTLDGQNGQPDDFSLLADALRSQMPFLKKPGHTAAFMGHGSPHQHNVAYEKLQAAFDKLSIPAVIGVVEETDHPNFADMSALLQARKVSAIVIMPLMIVSGDHANNDMAGPEDDSWVNRLTKAGYRMEASLGGLGRNPQVQALFVQHVRDVMTGN